MKVLPLEKNFAVHQHSSGVRRSSMITKQCRMWPHTVGTNVHALYTTSADNDTGNDIPLAYECQWCAVARTRHAYLLSVNKDMYILYSLWHTVAKASRAHVRAAEPTENRTKY